MSGVGAPQRWASMRHGGRKSGRGLRGRSRAAIAAVIAALLGVSCMTTGAPTRSGASPERVVRSHVDAGLAFYAGGDYAIAAQRFAQAAEGARRCCDAELERRARAAECASWLRARRLADLDTCTRKLEALQRSARRSDPALNTLVALGAIAGGRELPSLRIPESVGPLVRAAAEEER